MATVLADGRVKKNDGTIITPKEGEWYDAQHYIGGTLSAAGQINSKANVPGAGQDVSKEVVNQTDPKNWDYIQSLKNKSTPSGGGGSAPTNGGGGSIASMFGGTGQGSINLEEIYNAKYNTPEIKAAKEALTAIDAKIAKEKADFEAARLLVDDNPFYSEATRQGKLQRLENKYNANASVFQTERAQQMEKLGMLNTDAQNQLNLAMKQYDINSQEYQQQLSKLNMLLSSGAMAGATAEDIMQISSSTGIPTGMLQSMVQKQTQDNIKTQVITSTNDAGVVTYAVVNQQTGEIISKQSLGAIGKADGGGSGSTKTASQQALAQFINLKKNSYGHIGPEDWRQALTAYQNDNLGTTQDFIENYAIYTDPYREDFSSAYGFTPIKRQEILGY